MSGKDNRMNISIPYNNDIRLVDKINELGLKNADTNIIFYFAPPIHIAGTGRRLPNHQMYMADGTFDSDLFEEDIIEFLCRCKKYHFETCVLFNDILQGMAYSNEDLKIKIPKIQRYLEHIGEKNLTDYVCIANPYLLEMLNWERIRNLKVKASVNFQIKSDRTIRMLNNLVKNYFPTGQLAEVEIQKDLLRDIGKLKEIREALDCSVKLSIIINEGCLCGCPYQIVHQLHSATIDIKNAIDYKDKFQFSNARCMNILASDPWLFLDANWILPRHIKKYKGIVDGFKLTDRSDDTDIIVKKVKAYFLNDYDRENINSLITIMQKEKWDFPERLLPVDFDQYIFSGKCVPEAYYVAIWEKIKSYNEESYPARKAEIHPIKLNKEELYKFEGID